MSAERWKSQKAVNTLSPAAWRSGTFRFDTVTPRHRLSFVSKKANFEEAAPDHGTTQEEQAHEQAVREALPIACITRGQIAGI
jgi:hypothetical protein